MNIYIPAKSGGDNQPLTEVTVSASLVRTQQKMLAVAWRHLGNEIKQRRVHPVALFLPGSGAVR